MTTGSGHGLYYRVMGSLALIAMVAMTLWQIHKGHSFSLYDVIVLTVFAAICLALIRPEKFDTTIKAISDRFGK